ncbi:hypothetical protein STEG23_020233 [Scotinomys teguina]
MEDERLMNVFQVPQVPNSFQYSMGLSLYCQEHLLAQVVISISISQDMPGCDVGGMTGPWEEEEESRAMRQGERRQPAMKKTRCRSYRFRPQCNVQKNIGDMTGA